MNADSTFFSCFILIYNNGPFVEAAVTSTLNLVYDNCEVLISDDCSTDDSWEKVQKVVAAYKGNKTIILNRNEVNLGINAHLNKIYNLAKAEYLVALAGDDVNGSLDRLYKLDIVVKKYHPLIISSNVQGIDETGKFFDYKPNFTPTDSANKLNQAGLYDAKENILVIEKMPVELINVGYLGASITINRKILAYNNFRLPESLPYEDQFLTFLANMQGSSVYCFEKQIQYRVSANNLTSKLFRNNSDPLPKILTWNKNNEMINGRKLSFLTLPNQFRDKHEINQIFNKLLIDNLRIKITMASVEKKGIFYKLKQFTILRQLKGLPHKVDAIILFKLVIAIFFSSLLVKKEISDFATRSKTFSNS